MQDNIHYRQHGFCVKRGERSRSMIFLILSFVARSEFSNENPARTQSPKTLAVMVGRHTTEILTLKTKSIKNKK